LFNKTKVQLIAEEISAVYPEFQTRKFVGSVTEKFPELELLERLYWIRDCLREYLPADYKTATRILVKALPAPCNPDLADDDFGDFIYGPYGAFVAEYGCTKGDLVFSLRTLREMTKRFSVEFPIRTFINQFPVETMDFLLKCTTDKHYHVRRLATEGTRGKLPWAKKVTISYKEPLVILDALFSDSTRYVTRSVANHMNDISKVDPELAIKTLKQWQQSGKQTEAEMSFIVKHSLRTLEKQGNSEALKMLGYKSGEVKVHKFQISAIEVAVGGALEFSFSVTSTGTNPQNLLVDYHLYFQKASGELAPKTFKITKTTIQPGETLMFSKRQPLRPMTTRVLYPGRHEVELQINGTTYPRKSFTLTTS